MQQSLRPFNGKDQMYTTEDILKAIKANMTMTAGPEQKNFCFMQHGFRKRIAVMQTEIVCPTQRWYSQLPLEIKKNWKTLCREIQKLFYNH